MNILKIDERLDKIEKLLLHNKRVLTFEEACDYTGFSRSYLYKLTAGKKIPHSCPNGKIIFFSKDRLDFWLLQNERESNQNLENKALAYTLRNKR